MSLLCRIVLVVCASASLTVVGSAGSDRERALANAIVPTATGSAWVARPARMLDLGADTTPRSVTLRALGSGRGAAWHRSRTALTGRVGARFVARGAAHGSLSGQRVRLVVRELAAGLAVARHRTTIRLRAGEDVGFRVAFRRTRAGSRFRFGVVVPHLRVGQRIEVSRVVLRHRRSGSRIPLSNGCTAGVRGVPSCGAYLGAAHGSNSDPADLEASTGGRLGVRRTYWTAGQVSSAVSVARNDLAHGRLPWISFKLPYSWADMAAGRGDSWAAAVAAQLGRLPGPVWVAFHHEPEGDGDIGTWRRIQERLAPIVRRTARNVAYTVILTGWNELYGDPEFRLSSIWPRGVKIDVAGFDVYNQYGVVRNGTLNTTGTNLRTAYLQPISAWAATRHVAWGLAETGYTDPASVIDPDWIQRTHRQLDEAGGIAFTYFDTTLNSVANWALSTTLKKQAYARARSGAPVLPLLG